MSSGSYEKTETLFLGNLDTLQFEELTPVDGEGRSRNFRGFGRRHRLYLVTEDALHVVDLRDL